jgi:hypothetical protein
MDKKAKNQTNEEEHEFEEVIEEGNLVEEYKPKKDTKKVE